MSSLAYLRSRVCTELRYIPAAPPETMRLSFCSTQAIPNLPFLIDGRAVASPVIQTNNKILSVNK